MAAGDKSGWQLEVGGRREHRPSPSSELHAPRQWRQNAMQKAEPGADELIQGVEEGWTLDQHAKELQGERSPFNSISISWHQAAAKVVVVS